MHGRSGRPKDVAEWGLMHLSGFMARLESGELFSSRHPARGIAVSLAKYGLPIAFLLVAVVMAFYYSGSNTAPGESGLAAINLLRSGVIGNPYLIPTGPTAHVSPILVGYLALVFSIFGLNTFAARIALSFTSGMLYAVSSFLTLRSCANDRRAFWCAFALMGLFPIFLFYNCVNARQWDQPLTSFVMVAAWSLLIVKPSPDPLPLTGIALLSGFGTLLSPGLGPSLICVAGIMSWKWRRYFSMPKSASMITAAIVVFLIPWGIRNELVLGKFIVTRSDFALEVALGNGAGADGTTGTGNAWIYHPHDSKRAAEEMARVGEVGYMAEMAAVYRSQIWSRPIDFLRLTANRFVFTITPPPRILGWEPPYGRLAGYFATAFGLLHATALLLSLLVKRARLLLLVFTILPLAPYWVSHVNIRYLAVSYFPTVIIVTWLLISLWDMRGHVGLATSPLSRNALKHRDVSPL